ncbi:unnamed protein product, partial [Mesorhabditis spiculigera]
MTSRILDSPITWEMLEADLKRKYKTAARTGSGRRAEFFAGGMGFISKIALVQFDWSEDRDRLPESAIVKITVQDPDFDYTKQTALGRPRKLDEGYLHNNELSFYNKASDPRKVPADLKIPKFFCGRAHGADNVEAGYIALERIKETVGRHFYDNVCRTGAFEALDELVKLAAFSLNDPESLVGWPDNSKSIPANVLARFHDEGPGLVKLMLSAKLQYPELADEMDLMIQWIPRFFDDFANFTELRNSTCPAPILCQGDIWNPNILWKLDGNGAYHVDKVIDWQYVHVGSAVEDLILFLHAGTSAEDIEENLFVYLNYYYNELASRLNPGAVMPWNSVQELLKQYEIAYIYMTMLLLPITIKMLKLDDLAGGKEKAQRTLDAKIGKQAKDTARFLKRHFME